MLHDAQRTISAQRLKGFNQHRRLDGHVQRAGDAGALERLAGAEFLAAGHQARHFGLGNFDFRAAEIGKCDIGDNVIFTCGHLILR